MCPTLLQYVLKIFWCHLSEKGKLIVLKYAGAIQKIICINCRRLHLLALRVFLLHHNAWNKQCKSIIGIFLKSEECEGGVILCLGKYGTYCSEAFDKCVITVAVKRDYSKTLGPDTPHLPLSKGFISVIKSQNAFTQILD